MKKSIPFIILGVFVACVVLMLARTDRSIRPEGIVPGPTPTSSSGQVELTVDRIERDGGHLSVLVTIVNHGSGREPYNPLYFKVKNEQGFEYSAGISIRPDALKSGNLDSGDRVKGWVEFQQIDGLELTLRYLPVTFRHKESIEVKLQ